MTKLSDEQIEELRALALRAHVARFLELSCAGANANLKHPHRAEWERLRALIARDAA